MACVRGPVVFGMGSPHDEADHMGEPRSHTAPARSSVASKPITFEQWARYRNDNPKAFGSLEELPPGENLPMTFVSWMMAAQYCNWLSEKEGIPKDQWCYPEKIEPGMKLPLDYLSRTGYRLPTAAEWEYACRAAPPRHIVRLNARPVAALRHLPRQQQRASLAGRAEAAQRPGTVRPAGQRRQLVPGRAGRLRPQLGGRAGRGLRGRLAGDPPRAGMRTGSYDSLPRLLRAATLHVSGPDGRGRRRMDSGWRGHCPDTGVRRRPDRGGAFSRSNATCAPPHGRAACDPPSLTVGPARETYWPHV